MSTINETSILYLAVCFYGLGYALNYCGRDQPPYRGILALGFAGWSLHSVSLALRWSRIGHGPFINLHEILSSNLWSLTLAYLLFTMLARNHRAAGRFIVPLLAMLMLWLLVSTPRDTHLPPTYDTIWLYFHVLAGKFFLALLMLASGSALLESRRTGSAGSTGPGRVVQSLSYRMLAFAFCFQSLMLLFGAIWAQDAWGRYWAWDPLETWAFLTWLGVIFVLHWRLHDGRQRLYAALVFGCFTLAFLTFFGVPFVSTAPHKGMI